MKQLYLLIVIVCWSASVVAQQEEQFTQFMQYKLGYNPGYAGSGGGIEMAGLVRNQWMGIEGSPQTQLLSFSTPMVNNRVGLGANIIRNTIGVTDQYTLETAYAYRLPVPRGFLGIGIQASARMFRVDFTRLSGTQPVTTDEAIPANVQSKLVPNFGAGLYYSGENFYLGFSVPRLLSSNIDLSDGDGTISREVRHFYLMGGTSVAIADGIAIEPNLLVKWLVGAPLDMDINVMAEVSEVFRFGVSYRLGGSTMQGFGESASFLIGATIANQVDLGLSYDLTLSQLRDFNTGSFEIMARYYLERDVRQDEEKKVDTPRFF